MAYDRYSRGANRGERDFDSRAVGHAGDERAIGDVVERVGEGEQEIGVRGVGYLAVIAQVRRLEGQEAAEPDGNCGPKQIGAEPSPAGGGPVGHDADQRIGNRVEDAQRQE